jgi:protein involved in polysaccharide export with SLBB domain
MKLRNLQGLLTSISAAVVLFSLVAGCQTTSQPVFNPPDVSDSSRSKDSVVDKLRVGDTVRVVFSNLSATQAPTPQEEQIKDDGTVTLPLVGAIIAAGKTTGELQTELQKAYAKYYVSMNVTVLAPERFYSIGGEVKTPNRYVYVGGTTVIKAIQAAGDFSDFAKRTKVVLTRADGKKITVNCDKALRDPRLDPPVYPGDSIHVPRRFF